MLDDKVQVIHGQCSFVPCRSPLKSFAPCHDAFAHHQFPGFADGRKVGFKLLADAGEIIINRRRFDMMTHVHSEETKGVRAVLFIPPLIPKEFQEFYQNSEVVRGYGVTGRVHCHSFRADKTRLQLMCCALVQEPGCLVISEGRSPERGTGFRNGLRELWRVKQEESFSRLQTGVQLPRYTDLYTERKRRCTAKWLSTICLLIVIFDKALVQLTAGQKRRTKG